MKSTLALGLEVDFTSEIPVERTVPGLLSELKEFSLMPKVLATGYMVALFERISSYLSVQVSCYSIK